MFGNKLNKIPKMVEKNQADKLSALLNDRDENVVLTAIDGLGQCTGDEAFNALVPLLHAANDKVRTHAVLALGKMGLPKARTHLLHLRDSEKDQPVLTAIAEALKQIDVKV